MIFKGTGSYIVTDTLDMLPVFHFSLYLRNSLLDNLHFCTVLHVVSISPVLFQLMQFTAL